MGLGGGEDIVGVELAWGAGLKVVPALPEFAAFVSVGIQLGILLGVAERLAKSGIEETYEVFRVLSRGWWRCGRCYGPFLPLP